MSGKKRNRPNSKCIDRNSNHSVIRPLINASPSSRMAIFDKNHLPEPNKKEDVSQEVFDLYDDYAHNRLDRRAFMQKLSVFAIGGITVPALMSFLMPDYKNNIQVAADDPRLESVT